ncbi:MAG: hypothetical protein M0D57_21185 [Sphingobacteriales bacterium JAD_PAG50586_3]|nr:MAG: hypothetical protein M0D57_21185 [Sphingobacteriales bacterium JAD_PAG50586_3]
MTNNKTQIIMQIGYITMISSFKQQGLDNSTAIGVTKAAIEVFEVGAAFTAVQHREGIDVTFKDGRKIQISNQEYFMVEEHCGFQSLNEADMLSLKDADYAQLCVAIICKSKEVVEGYDSFKEALDDINNGASLFDGAKHLGVAHYCVSVPNQLLNQKTGNVGASAKQTVFVSNSYFDEIEQPTKTGILSQWSRFATKLYNLDKLVG